MINIISFVILFIALITYIIHIIKDNKRINKKNNEIKPTFNEKLYLEFVNAGMIDDAVLMLNEHDSRLKESGTNPYSNLTLEDAHKMHNKLNETSFNCGKCQCGRCDALKNDFNIEDNIVYKSKSLNSEG